MATNEQSHGACQRVEEQEIEVHDNARQGVPELVGDELWDYLVHSAHGWQAWEDGYVAGHLACQGALIDRVLQAEADADRYYMIAFNPPQVVRVCLSYSELCRRRGDPEAARRAEERIARLFPSMDAFVRGTTDELK
jgi:hypothetical protein